MGKVEKRIETRIKDWINKNGGRAIKYQVGMYDRAGTPDLIGCFRGRGFLLEVKAPDGEIRKLQEITLEDWRDHAGAITGVVFSLEEAQKLLLGAAPNENHD